MGSTFPVLTSSSISFVSSRLPTKLPHGDLLAVSAEKDFGSINKKDYGLISLPVYESAGLIWAILNPKSEVDIPTFFSGYDKMLDTFSFSDWIYVSKREGEEAHQSVSLFKNY